MYRCFEEIQDRLNEQQKEAAQHVDGPAIILAVAGSGKTTTLCTRTANLILNHRINPKTIMTLTFSKAAAKDMKKRFGDVFGHLIDTNHLAFSTIHAFAYKIILQYYRQMNRRLMIIEDSTNPLNKHRILKNIYQQLNNGYATEETVEEMLSLITYIKNMMLRKEEIAGIDTNVKNFIQIYNQYETFKEENLYIDYDDMLTVAYKILKERPKLLEGLQNRYQYWQIDEFQDTSKIQYEMIKLLIHPKNNIFCVGDDDQTLYSWRGSYPKILLDFNKVFKKAKVYFMEENFRSTKDIVELSDYIIDKNKERYKKNIFTNNLNGPAIMINEFKDQTEQINTVIERIKESNTEKAILYRNNFSAIPFMDKLNEENIDFYIREHKLSFLKHWIVNDIICFINLAYDPCDFESFTKIYYKLDAYLSKDVLNYVGNLSKKQAGNRILDIVLTYDGLKPRQRDRIHELKLDFDAIKSGNKKNIIGYIEKEMYYGKYLQNQDHTPQETANNILGTLKYLARDCSNGSDLMTKLDTLQIIIQKAKKNVNSKLILSTVHASKGLEFEEVYLIDLIEGLFPFTSNSKEENDSEIEEERRVYYVALTRAINKLRLCTLKTRFNNQVNCSRFISETKLFLKKCPSTYNIGMKITHKQYGEGEIKSISSDKVAKVTFKKHGTKKLLLDFCEQNNLIYV
ncbi:ATP-dependent helicase [Serpentinicella sp. ANB-PHB4]|uniref:ATP-dependent helicase n=1 Tax=Serpentinicella sp. ANB-PHB4 TaxID=3074076 RepID=UPI0028667A8A|nr:ATP-dependent helicase [Serpentinicella sp. ANB-PHB4]MDR5658449.1 ATP-dependent helicase [Serpentinicella sp. ANB-PHB4]